MPKVAEARNQARKTRWRPTPLIWASIVLHLLCLLSLVVAPVYWGWALGAVAANHALLTLVGLWPRSRWLGTNYTRLPETAIAQKQWALTIDDGPDPDVTPRVLDMLDRHGAKATFFCIGEKAARCPALCRDIVQRGHAIENHTQHHRHTFAFFGLAALTREIETAQATLTSLAGRTPAFFRAPAGIRSPLLDPVLTRLGLRLVAWTTRGFDTRISNAATVSRRLTRHLEPGAILLLHDGNSARSPQGVPGPTRVNSASGSGIFKP